jgi:hypothetical protein
MPATFLDLENFLLLNPPQKVNFPFLSWNQVWSVEHRLLLSQVDLSKPGLHLYFSFAQQLVEIPHSRYWFEIDFLEGFNQDFRKSFPWKHSYLVAWCGLGNIKSFIAQTL